MSFDRLERCAWVNRSNINIPVYSSLVPSGAHAGGQTAGGTKIGEIYSDEFFTSVPIGKYITTVKIFFRGPNRTKMTGYIESSSGYAMPDYPWVDSQKPYHYYNSNGSTLVSSPDIYINGSYYKVFTVKRPVSCRDKSNLLLDWLPVGTQIATNQSTTGESFGDYMLFLYKRSSASDPWVQFFSNNAYAFVDLDLSNGSVPSDRSIR